MTARVAVVTPYYREDEAVLRACLDSVKAQTIPCRHVLHADGFPIPYIGEYDADHIVSSRPHRDNGNFGRGAGAQHAFQQDFEYVAFLDADNWFAPNHCETMVAALERTGAHVAASGRAICTLDGKVMLPFDPTSDGVSFADTSTLMVRRTLMPLMLLWTAMPRQLGPACDQIFWLAMQTRGIKIATTGLPTMMFRSQYANHYRALNMEVPPGAKEKGEMDDTIAFWQTLPPEQRHALLTTIGAVPNLSSVQTPDAA
ncbi:MAG: glycosyltransferase [Hyphomonadaceae bacterium]